MYAPHPLRRRIALHNEQQCQSEAQTDKSVGNWFVGRQAKLRKMHLTPYRNDRRAVSEQDETASIRLKTGIPKGLAPGRAFAYFSHEGKVGRRRPTPAGGLMVLPLAHRANHPAATAISIPFRNQKK